MASNADISFQPGEKKKGKTRHRPSAHDSKQHKHKTGSINIHVDQLVNLQVGNNNKMFVNYNSTSRTGPYTRSKGKVSCTEVDEIKLTPVQQSRLRELQDSSEEVDSILMAELSKCWGRRWHKYGKRLKLTDIQLENIDDNVDKDSDQVREVSYQVLLSWKKQTDDPSVKNLISLLTQDYDYTPLLPLLDFDNYWNPIKKN